MAKRRAPDERKYSLAGSNPGGGGGKGSGIPAGSRPSGGRGSGSGIPAGSRPSGGGRSGSGIPAGSSVRGKKRRGRAGIPAGSKDAVAQVSVEQKADNATTVSVEEDDSEPEIVALVSATGVKDSVGDVIEPGAYAKTLATREAQPVWHHGWPDWIGATKDIRELMPGDPFLADKTLPNGDPWPAESGGLLVTMVANRQTDVGERAYQNIKFANKHRKGGVPWSIGFRTTKSSKDKDGTRRIKELDLFEYSPVLHGANSNTTTLSVKSLDEALDALHAGGYDTSELDVKTTEDTPFDGLDPDEIKQLATFADIVDAYLAEVGVKRAVTADEVDELDPTEDDAPDVDVLPTLAARLEDVLVAEDYADLLDAADVFDGAVQAGDEAAIAAAVAEFMEVFEAEEAGDPDDPDAWNELRDVVGDALDDAHLVLYGERPDDAEADEADDEGDDLEGDDDGDEDVGGQSGDEHYESDSDYDSTAASGDAPADAGDGGGEKRARRGERKEISQSERDKHASSGAALSDGSYPIASESQLRSAIRLRSQGNAPNKVVDAHIRKRAKALGLESMLPDDLKSGSSSDESSSSGSSGKKWALPDLEFGGAVDDIMAAIDFGASRV